MQNGLQLNIDKSEALVAGTPSKLQVVTSTTSSVTVARADLPLAEDMKVLALYLIVVWHSTDTSQRWHEPATTMPEPSGIFVTCCPQNSLLLWPAAWYSLGWTTAMLCCMVLQSAVFRSCSVSRTLWRGSSHSRQEGHMLYHCWNSYIGFLFVNGWSTSWPDWHSRSVVHQPQRTSPITSDRVKLHVVFVPPTRLYCTNLRPELTLLTVLSVALLLQSGICLAMTEIRSLTEQRVFLYNNFPRCLWATNWLYLQDGPN